MEKDTDKLHHELKKSDDFFETFAQNTEHFVENTVMFYLNEWLEEKKLTKAQVIRRSAMSEVTGYQYFDGKRNPSRERLIALCFGLGLNDEEANQLLKKSGYARLYAKHVWDAVIIYGLAKDYSIEETNLLLFEKGLDTLGDF
ncbi:helix-turn-helix domain-containing protein [Isobaculum melis]|uniref:Uncharacterized protein n=1 Tax=Isobaculum melis TaxID=142588 RepID=A0A1H9TBH3_9LACT|nr:helix-turn-helix transcriptional regulator [Isobaculum melis]SER94478.1 hypothetical protein SAMN04488559_1127 [Isobaculum melis]